MSQPKDARSGLIKEHTRLVKAVALKIASRLPSHVELDDLISSGMIGLLDAIDKFDQAKSVNFKKYAEIRIKGAILDELRAMDHVSRTVRRQSSALGKSIQSLQDKLGRKVSDEEVAEHLGLEMTAYQEMVTKLRPVLVMSFEDLTDSSNRDPMQFLPDPNALDPQSLLHQKTLIMGVRDHIDSLKERERMVVRLYYYKAMTLKEIGKILGVSESRVSQMLTQATGVLGRRIRRQFASEGLTSADLD